MIGNEASKYRSLLELSHPTDEGIVKNWEDMGLLMKYSFEQVTQLSFRLESMTPVASPFSSLKPS
jgi:actin-related protein 2